MRIRCHTNLDLLNEEWPQELPALPRVGDIIESKREHRNKDGRVFRLELQVVQVLFKYHDTQQPDKTGEWIPEVELHMTNWQKGLLPEEDSQAAKGSITAFYHWYAPLVGKRVSYFI